LKRAIQAASFADYRLDCMLNFAQGRFFRLERQTYPHPPRASLKSIRIG